MDEEEGMAEKNGDKGHDRGGEEFSGPQHQADRGDDVMVSGMRVGWAVVMHVRVRCGACCVDRIREMERVWGDGYWDLGGFVGRLWTGSGSR